MRLALGSDAEIQQEQSKHIPISPVYLVLNCESLQWAVTEGAGVFRPLDMMPMECGLQAWIVYWPQTKGPWLKPITIMPGSGV
jgi:hypothetical protein